jgi:signal transduction histidine kinase
VGEAGRARLWRWLGAVRARASIVSVLAVGGALAATSFSVLALLRGSLDRSDTNTARSEAMIVASIASTRGTQGILHHPFPNSIEEMAVQLVDLRGAVLTSSRNVEGEPAMVTSVPASGHFVVSSDVLLRVRRFTDINLHLDNRFVVAALGVRAPLFSGAVLVAYSLGAADHAVDIVEVVLAIAAPALSLLVGALVWWLTGWALRPVEVVRSEVERYSATDLARRVPEPRVRDEVGRLARTMNDMLGRLEAASARQRRLLSDVSHELRNPLAALRAQLEVMAEHPSDITASLLAHPLADVDRMSRMVDDLLTLARIDEGAWHLRMSEVDMDEIVLFHADRLRLVCAVEVSVRGVSAARVVGDEAQLSRMVANLADNAARYAASIVEFAVSIVAGNCELRVRDDGPGVPPDERERIFGRFVRLDESRPLEGGGAGLGLSIVKEIVSAHGGDVWVEDAGPGGGACFRARFPAGARTPGAIVIPDVAPSQLP